MRSAQVANNNATNQKGESCVQLNRCYVMCVSVFRGDSMVMFVCVLASTLCKYDLRKGDLFVLSWVRVRRMCLGSLS